MTHVSLLRLNLLRAAYAFVAIGILLVIWPSLLSHRSDWPLMNSVVAGMMAGVSVLAALGLRYPLQMLPVLLFELLWKAIWLTMVALPLWTAGRMDPRTMQSVIECLLAVVLIPVIPWRYVVRTYVTQPGARWRRPAAEEN
ncbi:MAG TPA: hypothetical protein VEC11_14760 [Allosphingosinicella sp.]|nr:hypothetical protein [Allosphingosinicella sp.]